MSEKRLREIYCDAFNCSQEDFPQQVFWRCLYPRARPLAYLLWWVNRGFFERDLELIKIAGSTRSLDQLVAEISAFGYARHSGGFGRRVMRVRVSRQRLLDLGTELFAQTQELASSRHLETAVCATR